MDNMNEIAALLHIHREASSHGNLLDNIAKTALKELRDLDAQLAPQPATPPVAVAPEEPDESTPVPPNKPNPTAPVTDSPAAQGMPSGEPVQPVEPPSKPINEEPASPPAEVAQETGGLDEKKTELEQPTGGNVERRI